MSVERITILSMLAFAFLNAHTQDFTLGQATVTSCSGVLHDSGGPGMNYGNNEDLVTTVCPDQVGGIITLLFTEFELSSEGTTPLDHLDIHDGISILDPLIGSYTGSALFNLIVTPGPENQTGCLTLHFSSNEIGTGGIKAFIECEIPCSTPVAVLENAGDTLLLCAGGKLPVDGSSSFANGSQGLAEWIWVTSPYQAGTATDAALDTLSFPLPGAYTVALQVMDSAECVSDPSSSLIVVVQDVVSFAGTGVSGSICPGEEVLLTGQAYLDGTVYMSSAMQDYGTGIPLPDMPPGNFGIPVNSDIMIDWYPDGASVTDSTLFEDVCISLEHSFMGDLVISLTCPNGQSATLHQQGGGGVNLGDATIGDNIDYVPGSCWTYCFSSNASQGTWVQAAQQGFTISTVSGSSLIPDNYTPVEPLAELIGCPVNGTWTLTLVDLWGGDNGTLCSWGLGLEPSVDSTFAMYSASLNLDDPDSAYWTGPGIVSSTPPTVVTALPPGIGTYDYSFTVVDSQGCVHDTTLAVSVIEPPIVSLDAGPDVLLCDGPGILAGDVVFAGPPDCTYLVVLYESFGDGWNGNANLAVVVNGISSDHAVPPGNMTDSVLVTVNTGQTLELIYTAGTIWNGENSFKLYSPAGALLYASPQGPASGTHYQAAVDCSGFANSFVISWSPAIGVENPGTWVTGVYPPASGWYVLTISLPGGGCAEVDSVWVENQIVEAALTYDAITQELCVIPNDFDLYQWYIGGESYSTTMQNCITDPPFGLWTAIAVNDLECDGVTNVVAICPEIAIIYEDGLLSTTPGLGSYLWSFNGTPLPQVEGPNLSLVNIGTYEVTVTMPGGCIVYALLEVESLNGILDSTAPDHQLVIVSPNPNRGDLRVDLPFDVAGQVAAALYDASGREVMATTFQVGSGQGALYWNVSVASGIYQIRLQHGDRIYWGRFVKE